MINMKNTEYYAKRFIKVVEERGGKVLGEYKGGHKKVLCLCSQGHECNPNPVTVMVGNGFCKVCARIDKEAGKKAFHDTIEKLGGKVLGEYNGQKEAVECLCVYGHKSKVLPSSARDGIGICKVCTGNSSEVAKEKFFKKVSDLGGQITGKYIDQETRVSCVCKKGHVTDILPSYVNGKKSGICVICSGLDSKTNEEFFIKRIREMGGKILGTYTNCKAKIECICSKGHKCFPSPIGIRAGHGMCRFCKQSAGESLLGQALEKLGFTPVFQAVHPSIPYLRYDFSIGYNDTIVYLEYHGIQHDRFVRFFHPTSEKFYEDRQRDLLKIDVARKNNRKIIIFDYTWKYKPLEEWISYLDGALKKEKLVIADSELHDWVFSEELSKETREKYMIKI
jgi:hypothetical protein